MIASMARAASSSSTPISGCWKSISYVEPDRVENSKLKRLKSAKSQTIDGIDVELFANIDADAGC